MKKNLKTPAFTIIEVLVAMVVLLLAVLSGFKLIGSFITTVANNQNTLTATYLAQECLENARNIRDSNWKKFDPWEEGLDTIKQENKAFGKFTITRLADISSETIQFKDFNEQGAEFTNTRTEKKSAKITCTISWNNDKKNLVMESILTNWKKQ